MILLPAIDLMSGEVVRLRQGKADQKTVYSRDPAAFAKRWEEEGGDYLHIVDLDAAFTGEQRNLDAVRAITGAISIPCELGGGMRSEAAIRRAFEAGVSRIVIGTRAAESLDFVRDMAKEFGGERIAVGIDARNGLVSVKGWTEISALTALDLARRAEDAGAGTIIYTDIATDGMLAGPNFAETEKMLAALKCQLVASGGVSSAGDVERLSQMPGLYGCIIGKALYDGAVHLRDLTAFRPRKPSLRPSPASHHPMRVLFLDCISGISGDMTVGALIDLGVKPSTLEWELSKLDIGDFHMHFDRQKRQGIEGVKFGIHEGSTHTHGQDESHETCGGHEHGHEHHHHDKEEAHAHEHEHGEGCEHHHHEHAHAHEEEHDHEHSHEHEHEHEHAHAHHDHHEHAHGRSHREIRGLIEASELSPFVKKHALSIFHRIAVAEGKIHGQPAEEVTFHEVGSLDSIADIVCACVGIEALGIEKVFVSSLQDGSGTIECSHGTYPLPAPATLEILAGIPLRQIDEPHELITPTGAAIAAEFGASFGIMPALKTEKIGYGVGTRDLTARPNVLRAVLGALPTE